MQGSQLKSTTWKRTSTEKNHQGRELDWNIWYAAYQYDRLKDSDTKSAWLLLVLLLLTYLCTQEGSEKINKKYIYPNVYKIPYQGKMHKFKIVQGNIQGIRATYEELAQLSTKTYHVHASKKHFSETANGNHLETTTLKKVLTLEKTTVEEQPKMVSPPKNFFKTPLWKQ